MSIICRSVNGWPVSRDAREIRLVTWRLAEVPNRAFTTVRVAMPLFMFAARTWNAQVSPLAGGQFDEWSYNVRQARTQDGDDPPRSNHGSGTAIDLDAAELPRGKVPAARIRDLVHRSITTPAGGVLFWGGDWHGANVDGMHLELAPAGGLCLARFVMGGTSGGHAVGLDQESPCLATGFVVVDAGFEPATPRV